MAQRTKKVVFTASTVALTIVFTLASIALPGGGYYNFGDIVIFVSAIVLGPLSGLIAGALGGALGDLILGYTAYAPFTLIIKALEGLIAGLIAKYAVIFTQKLKANKSLEAFLVTLGNLLGGLIMALGYFLIDGLLLSEGKWSGGIINLPWNVLQGSVSAVLTTVLLYIFRLKYLLSKIYNAPSQTKGKSIVDSNPNTTPDSDNTDGEKNSIDKSGQNDSTQK